MKQAARDAGKGDGGNGHGGLSRAVREILSKAAACFATHQFARDAPSQRWSLRYLRSLYR
jgi:hypothetical protein